MKTLGRDGMFASALWLQYFEVDQQVPSLDVHSGSGNIFAVDCGKDGEWKTVIHGLHRHEESVGELCFEGEACSSDEASWYSPLGYYL